MRGSGELADIIFAIFIFAIFVAADSSRDIGGTRA